MEKIRVSSLAEMTAIEEEMAFEDRWDERTVYQRLCATRDIVPDRPAVSFQLKSDPGYMASTLTWSDLTDQVTRAANLFRSIGIGKDDVVAYMLPTTPETLVCLLGGMTAGIVHPINPLLEVSQIAALLKESGAKALVTLRSFPKADVAQKAAEAVSMSPGVETLIEVDLLPHVSGPLRFLISAPASQDPCFPRGARPAIQFRSRRGRTAMRWNSRSPATTITVRISIRAGRPGRRKSCSTGIPVCSTMVGWRRSCSSGRKTSSCVRCPCFMFSRPIRSGAGACAQVRTWSW